MRTISAGYILSTISEKKRYTRIIRHKVLKTENRNSVVCSGAPRAVLFATPRNHLLFFCSGSEGFTGMSPRN
jgi:hypothetical protein